MSESPFLPQFNLETESDVDAIYGLITERLDRRSFIGRLECALRQRGIIPGRSMVVACGEGGLVAMAVNQLLLDSLAPTGNIVDCLPRLHRLAERLVEFYGLPADWLPPRMLFREALALSVRRHQVVRQIERQMGPYPQLLGILDQVSAGLAAVADAFLLPDDRVDELLEPDCHPHQ